MAHVLFVEANVPAIDAMRRAKELGHRVSLVRSTTFRFYPDNEATHAVLDTLDHCVDVDSTADPDVLEKVVGRLVDEDPPDAVISQIEFTIEAAAIACDRLGLPFTNVDAVRNARDKGVARRLLAEAGLPTVRHRTVRTVGEVLFAAGQIGYPVVIKPVSGADSILSFRADTPGEARVAGTRVRDGVPLLHGMIREQFHRGILVEEHLAGELVSAEIGALNGRFHRFMVSGRPRARENECIELGSFMPADISAGQREACLDYAERVCRALGLDLGIFHIEIMLTERGPVLVEANPRLMGGIMPYLYRAVTGQDIHDYEIDIHLRREIAAPPPISDACLVTSRKLMPRAAGRLADPLDIGWLADYRDRITAFFPYRLDAGIAVAQNEILARYVIRHPDRSAADKVAEELLDRFENSLGVALYH